MIFSSSGSQKSHFARNWNNENNSEPIAWYELL